MLSVAAPTAKTINAPSLEGNPYRIGARDQMKIKGSKIIMTEFPPSCPEGMIEG